jgi:hypothetical protein
LAQLKVQMPPIIT